MIYTNGLVEWGVLWEPSMLIAEFICKPKVRLKNNIYYFKKGKKKKKSAHRESAAFPQAHSLL